VEDRFLVKLLELRRRQAWVEALEAAIIAGRRGGWLGLGLGLLLASWGRPLSSCLEALWVWPALTGLGFLWGLSRPRSLRQVAHQTDRHCGLQDRLLTCYAHQVEQRRPSAVSQLLWEDTLARLQTIDARSVFPCHWRQPMLGWLLPGLLWFSAWMAYPYLPGPVPDPWEGEVLASRDRMSTWSRRLSGLTRNPSRRRDLEQLVQRASRQVPHQLARQLRLQKAKGEQHLQALQQLSEQLRLMEKGGAGKHGEASWLSEVPEHARRRAIEKALQALRQGDSQPLAEQLRELQREQQQELALQQALEDELSQLPGSEVAQQGQGQGQDPERKSGRGQAQPNGSGPGMGADWGKGSSNEQQKASPLAAKGQGLRQSQRRPEKTLEFQRLYGVERKHLESRPENVQLAGARGRLLKMPQVSRGQARSGDPSLIAEQEEFLRARVAAEQSVAEERIPSQHRDAVRRYFDELDPR